MSKIKLTKNELKKQKDDLKRFKQYLPALQLKKQQLQIEIIKIQKIFDDIETEIQIFKDSVYAWVSVFAEKYEIRKLISVEDIRTHSGNIAGIEIPILDDIEFHEKEYNFYTTPIWIDYGIEAVKKMITLKINKTILEKQIHALKEELRIITQRVNLFEEVKIPDAQENVKKIQIFLGDMQTAAVVIGKIAKDKIEKKQEVLAV